MHRNDPEIERLIVRYWRQHKTVAVILAYLRFAHRVSVWSKKIFWASTFKNSTKMWLHCYVKGIAEELETRYM
ncbi:hypothetical protein EMCRGX_G004894 [Ephydatia muelleri]